MLSFSDFPCLYLLTDHQPKVTEKTGGPRRERRREGEMKRGKEMERRQERLNTISQFLARVTGKMAMTFIETEELWEKWIKFV